MAHPTLPQIIASFQAISKQAEACDPELASKIKLAILDLQNLQDLAGTDQVIDRSKKITETIALILRLLYEFFNGS